MNKHCKVIHYSYLHGIKSIFVFSVTYADIAATTAFEISHGCSKSARVLLVGLTYGDFAE